MLTAREVERLVALTTLVSAIAVAAFFAGAGRGQGGKMRSAIAGLTSANRTTAALCIVKSECVHVDLR